MKKLLLLGALLSGWIGMHAQGLVPKAIPCFEPKVYTPGFIPGSMPELKFENYSCVDMFGPIAAGGPNVIEKGHTDIVGGKYVHFGPGVHIGPMVDSVPPYTPGHYMHAYIGTNDFDVVWFEPNGTPGEVGQYEKLELGVKLPSPIDSMVYNYVHHGTTTEWLNPFDPDAINVEATFSFLGEAYSTVSVESSTIINGFYYGEFERNITDNGILSDDNWIEDTTSYTFRIRYAPTLTGNWSVKIKITTPLGVFEVLPIGFKCVLSGNPGYVTVGTNTRFLKLGSETFVPVGANLPHPTCWECLGSNIDAGELFQPNPMPSKGYTIYHNEMEDLKNNGGNYFRMLISPATTDIEFEHLNNYSDRMNRAWEVDRILDKAKELGLYMHFNLQFHYTLENPTHYNMWYWDWMTNDLETVDPGHEAYGDSTNAWVYDVPDPGYCYHTELGLESPIEFFTNSLAIANYKKKLRYIISRYGYSTNIAVIELYSEIDNAGAVNEKAIVEDSTSWLGIRFDNVSTNRPYWTTDTVPEKIQNWEIEMARYIKEDLDHGQHLISADYTFGSSGSERVNNSTRNSNDPRIPGQDVYLDDTYTSEYIDIMGWNQYDGFKVDRYQDLIYREVPYWYNNKPVMFPEIGSGSDALSIQDCDNNAEFIRTLWCSAFSGSAGPGLDYNPPYDKYDTWKYFGKLNEFLSGYDFASGNWQPAYNQRADDLAEFFALVTDDEAIGVISNRTFNYFTRGDYPCNNTFNSPGSSYNNPIAIIPGSPNVYDQLKINTMSPGDYIVDYYNALTGEWLASSNPTVLPFVYDLLLEHPMLCAETITPCTELTPLIGFKAMKLEARSSVFKDSTDNINKNEALDFNIRPNPASESVTLNIPALTGDSHISVISGNGQVIYNCNVLSPVMQINTATWESGLFLIILRKGSSISTKKLLIQHEKY